MSQKAVVSMSGTSQEGEGKGTATVILLSPLQCSQPCNFIKQTGSFKSQAGYWKEPLRGKGRQKLASCPFILLFSPSNQQIKHGFSLQTFLQISLQHHT